MQDFLTKTTWNQARVLARHKLSDGFSTAKLYQQRISRLQVVMKIFQINLSCQSSYSTWKLVGLFFPRFPKRKWFAADQSARLCSNVRLCFFEIYVTCMTSPVADLQEGPPSLALFWVKKGEMTDGRRSSWAGKIEPCPFLSTKSGSATAQMKTNMK